MVTTLTLGAAIGACAMALASCAGAGRGGGGTTAGGGGPALSPGATAGVAGTASASPARTVSPAPGPATTPPVIRAGRSGLVRLTQQDNGATVVLRLGQSVSVVLGGHGQLSWDPEVASQSQVSPVLRLAVASGGYPASSAASASFVAIRAGTATIGSASDAACLHSKPLCRLAQQLWRVTVIVTG